MADLKKITHRSLWIFLGLLVFVAAVHLILPLVVNTHLLKETIRARVQTAVNGQFDYTSATPGILPRPQVAIINPRLSIPDKIDVSAASISVSLRLLPLLTGKVHIAALSVQSPVVELRLPEATPPDAVSDQQTTRDTLKKHVAAVLGAITGPIKDGRVLVSDGHMSLMRGANRIQLEALDLQLVEADGLLQMEVRGRPSDVDQFSAQARINPSSLDGSGRLDASGIRPRQILAAWLPEKNIDIPDAALDLDLTFETQGLETWRMVLNGQIPELPFSRDSRDNIQQVELNSTLSVTPDQVEITLSRLDIKAPRVQLSGSLLWQPETADRAAALQAELQADTIDLTAVRQAAIARLGNTPIYLDIVRGGVVSQLHTASRSASWSGLVDVNNLIISGQVKGASIRIPGPDLALRDVSGNISLSKGTLAADQAAARLDTTTAANGRLSMDLMAAPIPLNLSVDLDVDLSLVPDLMKKFIGNEQILAQLNRLSITHGRAAGTLALTGTVDNLDVKVGARDISLTLEDPRLPAALTLTGDQFTYSADGIGFKNIGVRMQGSRLSRLSGKLHWDPEPTIDLQDVGADLVCQEIYPLLTATLDQPLPAMAPKTLEGLIVVANAAIHGPLTNPRQWQFKAGGNLTEIKSETDIIPGPLTITTGKFDIDPQGIDVSGLAIQWLDAALDISAGVNGYQTKSPRIELKALKGAVGDRAATWIHQRMNLAPELRIHTPVSIKSAWGRWQGDEGIRLHGDLMWPGDLNISLAVSAGNHEFNLDHLRISDEQTDASIHLRYNSAAGQLDLGYKGHLDNSSLAKLWLRDNPLLGDVDGDFSASVKIDAPRQSVLRGQLDARRLILAVPGLDPITIKEARISAHDQILDIRNLDLTWLQQQVQLAGEVEFSEDSFQVNLAVLSDALDLTIVKNALTKDDREKEPAPTAAPQRPRPKVQGSVELDIARLQYDHYIFRPLKGDLVIQEDSAVLNVAQAGLCGLTTEGRIALAGKDLSLELRPIATGQTLQYTSGCLSGTPSTERYEGTLDVDGRISTRGQTQAELIQNLKGHTQINITDGRIQNVGNAGIFTNLLAHLKINNIISGNAPDLRSKDFLYKSLSLQMDINQGDITLNEAYLNSDALNIVAEGVIHIPTKDLDLNVLVSPLTTVDAVIGYIPIVGKILKGTLVAVPVKVRGDIADPKIIPLSPGAIGSRLTGILGRTLKAPFQLIIPSNSGNNDTGNQEKRETDPEADTP